MSESERPPKPRIEPGSALMFIGDHTSPDAPGYIEVIRGVLSRFYPHMNLRLISAGSRGQTPAGLRSDALMDLLTSSRPDYLVIGMALTDAAREPLASQMLAKYRAHKEQSDQAAEATFGPEHRATLPESAPVSDSGKPLELDLQRLKRFTENMREAITTLAAAGVRPILLTPAMVTNDAEYPLNIVLRAYGKAIRALAAEKQVPLVDVEQSFRDMFDRAANYKQRAILTGADGNLNAQGQTLIARTFLDAFGLLPGPGFRPSR